MSTRIVPGRGVAVGVGHRVAEAVLVLLRLRRRCRAVRRRVERRGQRIGVGPVRVQQQRAVAARRRAVQCIGVRTGAAGCRDRTVENLAV